MIDGKGREVLSFVQGETALPPVPRWALTSEALDSVAHLLRHFHDATAGFDAESRNWSASVPAAYRDGEVVCHN